MHYRPIHELLEDLLHNKQEPESKSKTFDASSDFDNWNTIKKKTEFEQSVLNNFPLKREVWIVLMGKNIGVEQNGTGTDFSRPMMVIKKFNNEMFWCIPLSTKQKELDYYFNFFDPANQPVSGILAQLKLVSIKRFDRKMYDCPWEIFDVIIRKLKKLLG